MAQKKVLFADLVDMSSPQTVLDEVCRLVSEMAGDVDIFSLTTVFRHVTDLYQGGYPGYRGCNTFYHDLRHVTDVFMALARLSHGACVAGEPFPPRLVLLGLISALLHDTGYIQKEDDCFGTGGKYSLTHVDRSIEFLQEYLTRNGYGGDDVELCSSLVLCTSLSTNIESIPFPSDAACIMGKMVGTADFLGQVADRLYLEKLLFLHREFREANIVGYDSELELLKKTIDFYGFIQLRLKETLNNVQRFMLHHLCARWDINVDLYQEAVDANLSYLERLLRMDSINYRLRLQREGIVDRLEALEAVEVMSQSGQREYHAGGRNGSG